MRPLTIVLLGLLALAGAGCQLHQKSIPTPPRAEEGLAARARAVLDTGSYAQAAALYREALDTTPRDAALRFGLAIALSYTDRTAAIAQFQWVMLSAKPGSPESIESQAWLARAGALPTVPVSRSAEPEREAGNAVLVGRAVFGEGGAKAEPMSRLQLFLRGQPDGPTKEERYVLRTTEDGTFRFPNVPPGPYMLTNRLAGQAIWRLRVELKPAEEKHLELNPGNSVAVRDDFPQGS